MSTNTDLDFKIGIVGPSRVGKTSLIATILKDAERLLAGTPAKMVPDGSPTKKRIADHYNDLQGSLRAGEFNPGAIAGTEEPFQFKLRLDQGNAAAGFTFGMLDFPGGWIDDGRRPESRESEWEECRQWLAQSTVLILPVESTVIMEAVARNHKRAVPSILTIFQIEQIARDWAKERAKHPHEPAMLLVCPVKCESYFSDNGGYQDASNGLFAAVRDYYSEVIQAVRDEASDVNVLYAPVDTLGCVDLIRTNWRPDINAPGGVGFSAEYRVRPAGKPMPKGGEAVLVSLCRHLVKAKLQAENRTVRSKRNEAHEANDLANEDKGLLGNLWLLITRERQQRQENAEKLADIAIKQEKLVESLGQIIMRLAEHNLGPRARTDL